MMLFGPRTRIHVLVSVMLASFPLTSWSADLQFSHVIVDPLQVPNGHKPKVIGDFAANGRPGLGAETAGQGFKLYQPPNWTPYLITAYGNGAWDEDSQVADVNNDGALDIIVGGLGGNTYWLENPLRQGKDPYNSTWNVHQIGFGRPSHDVVVGDINGDGKIDVATESGIYLQGATPDTWVFIGAPYINRDLQGTALINISNDGFLDLIAPYQNATQLAWFENPLHHGANPATNVWTPHVIDATPGFSSSGSPGYMTIAVADFNHDGRVDIAMGPMYDDGNLAWYEAPAAGNSSWVKHVIGPVSYVHQGTLQVADFDGDGQPDIAFAEQEQSASKRIGIFFNQGAGSSWALQVLATSGGHNFKAGVVDTDTLPSIWNTNHGYYGAPDPLELWRNTGMPPPTPLSDNFDAPTLNTNIWSFVNPVGNGSFFMTGTELALSAPGGSNHDPHFGGVDNAVRVVQTMSNSDFTIELKFNSIPTLPYQYEGLIVEQDAANYLCFQFLSTGDSLVATASTVLSHNETGVIFSTIFLSAGTTSLWLRIQRTGNTWTQALSGDGAQYITVGSFTQALAPVAVGPFAGNFSWSTAPAAFTARVDYFLNEAHPVPTP